MCGWNNLPSLSQLSTLIPYSVLHILKQSIWKMLGFLCIHLKVLFHLLEFCGCAAPCICRMLLFHRWPARQYCLSSIMLSLLREIKSKIKSPQRAVEALIKAVTGQWNNVDGCELHFSFTVTTEGSVWMEWTGSDANAPLALLVLTAELVSTSLGETWMVVPISEN